MVVRRRAPLLNRVMRRQPLGAFFALAYLFSWSYWIPVAAAGGHLSHFPGLLGPLLAAAVVTAMTRGRTGMRDLLRRMGRWRVPARGYAACLVPVAAAALALAGMALAGADLPTWDELSSMPGLPDAGWLPVFALVILVNGYGEETGWRGFAWTPLRERHTLGGAAVLLAVPWAIWHVPTFWIDSGLRDFPLAMLPGFFAGMAAGAVVLGWLYEHALSSIALVAVWHAVLNMVSGTEGAEGLVAAAVSTVVIFWAIGILRNETSRLDPTIARVETIDTLGERPGDAVH